MAQALSGFVHVAVQTIGPRSHSIRLSTLVRLAAVALATLFAAMYLFPTASHPYLDSTGFALGECIYLWVILSSGSLSRRAPPVLMFNITVLLFVGTRLLGLVAWPDSLLLARKISPELFNRTLLYMGLGCVAAVLGLVYGWGIALRRKAPAAGESAADEIGSSQRRLIVAAAVGSIFFEVCDYLVFGYVGSSGSGAHLTVFSRYFMRLVNSQAALLMVVACYLRPARRAVRDRGAVAVVVLYVAFKSIIGSRGALLEIGLVLMSVLIFYRGDFLLPAKRAAQTGVILILSVVPALYLYELATQWREVFWMTGTAGPAAVADIARNSAERLGSWRELVGEISYRVNLIDPTIPPLNSTEPGWRDISDVVNVWTSLVLSLDRVIPGHLLSDHMFSEYAFGLFYMPMGIRTSETSQQNYVGFEWGMWGISYQLFGYGGGLAFIFIGSGLVSAVCGVLRKHSSSYWLSCFGAMAVYGVYECVRTLGIDNLVDRTFHLSVNLLLYLLLFSGRMRSRPRPLTRPRA